MVNIRKIIKEEMDELSWIDNSNSPVYKGMLFYYYEDEDNLYKIMELTDEYEAIVGRPSDTEVESHHSRYLINKVEEYLENGEWIEYKGSLTE
jgi:hypothetical protein